MRLLTVAGDKMSSASDAKVDFGILRTLEYLRLYRIAIGMSSA